MLLVKDEYDQTHTFIMVDAHTHIKGEGLKGLLPSEFISRYHHTVKELAQDMRKNPDAYRYSFPWKITKKNPDFYDYCLIDLFSLVHSEDISRHITQYLGFDFFITLPQHIPYSF